jgi:hypothetical protein
MNLIIANHYLKDAELWRLALGVGTVLDIHEKDKLKAFAEISIKLDELIYLKHTPVDWVLYAFEEKEIHWGKFLKIEPAVSKTDDTIFLADSLTGNFYCRPHVFSMLGGLYKLNTQDNRLFAESRASADITKMLYSIVRSGYDIKLL